MQQSHPNVSIDPLQIHANNELKQISQQHGAEFIDFSKGSFFRDAPKFNNTFIYYDSNHLNELGSKYYAEATGNQLLSILNKQKSN